MALTRSMHPLGFTACNFEIILPISVVKAVNTLLLFINRNIYLFCILF
jgi:hypothetical protein